MKLKFLGTLLLSLCSTMAFSASIDLGSFKDTDTLNAVESITRVVYDTEYYDTTCSREVRDGSRTVCSEGRTETRCEKVPGVGAVCREVSTGRTCHSEPDYRTEYYSCRQSRTVSRNVHDYYVRAKVELAKNANGESFDLNGCMLGVSIGATAESFYAQCNNAIVRTKVISRNEVREGGDKLRTVRVAVDFSSIEGLNALKGGLQNLQFNKNTVSFVTADLEDAENFRLNLKITRNRFIIKDIVVINRKLTSADYKLEKLGAGLARVIVDLSKIDAAIDAKKKHTIKVDLTAVKPVVVTGAINTPALQNELTSSIVVNQ